MRYLLPFVMLLVAASITGCVSGKIETVRAYRAARESRDDEAARALLSDDPRVWYEKREGPGSPLVIGGGRWATWDEHFRSHSTSASWRVEDDCIWTIVTETNDYYRLTGREFSRYRQTYFLNGDNQITGSMVSAAPEAIEPHEVPLTTSRFDEFEAWATVNEPEEFAYLVPEGRIDPTGDRAPRMRALLNRWRATIGLEPIL